ncbi:MAG: HD domain-containing protein, partial [Acidobacteria bacterium]|nr:HD domain-containing protein [Acidobacteriota bacterium]
MSNRELGLTGKTYIAFVSSAGSIAILSAIISLVEHPVGPQWLVLAALTLLGGLFTVRVPSVPATVSVSETFVFLTVLLFGTAPAVLTVALEGFLISLWRYRRNASRILFNTFEAPVSLWIASTLFFAFVGRDSSGAIRTDIGPLLLPLFGLASGYFLLNSCLMAIAVAFETRVSPFSIWSKHFLWLSIDYFGGASVAALLVLASAKLTVTTLAVVTPILIICYLTFRLATERVEDATRHLKELNTLYISTIETLASAIDAKDQITHGHIRRVQTHAVSLAKRLGVRDEPLIRAIEAAALLHDMGKLAIPEYILNKPGRLTDAEFEKMKAHASVGAEILAGVNFPYPVVPIVRHHHEYWDGTGYPDQITGADIPIGARILAVVDCFDALTSDRPYRPKL